jgi:hypothetical protein
LVPPRSEEFKRRGRLRFWRGSRAISAGAEKKHSEERELREFPSRWIGVNFQHADNLRSMVA